MLRTEAAKTLTPGLRSSRARPRSAGKPLGVHPCRYDPRALGPHARDARNGTLPAGMHRLRPTGQMPFASAKPASITPPAHPARDGANRPVGRTEHSDLPSSHCRSAEDLAPSRSADRRASYSASLLRSVMRRGTSRDRGCGYGPICYASVGVSTKTGMVLLVFC
jgi:hypothetical protein